MKRHYLSELVDDELKGEEAASLLGRLNQDEALLAQWARYHLIRDAISNHLTNHIGPELPYRVREAVEQEPHYLVGWRERLSGVRRLGTGLALAATVAGVAVVARPWLDGGTGFTGDVTVARVDAVAMDGPRRASDPSPGAQATARADGMRWNHVDPDAEVRLNGFLVSHSTHAERLSPMRAYARVVSYHGSR